MERESPLQRGEQHGELIMYPLHKMLPRNEAACEGARTSGGVEIQKGKGTVCPGSVTRVTMPRFLLHSTSIELALNILAERGLRATGGVCGHAAYAFRMEDASMDEILKIYARGGRSGYNRGAAFVMDVNGMLVHGHPDMVLPPGILLMQVCTWICLKGFRNSGHTRFITLLFALGLP